LNDSTHHIVNIDRLALMKPTAYLINTARGPIVDQAALTQVLQAGAIAGAGLDVLEQEPPNADDPILTLENAIITPHALCWTDQIFQGNGDADTKAVLDIMSGRIPTGIVNREILDNQDWRARVTEYGACFA
jgi:D-3-phosphoglycerate dehydrogenase